MKRNTRQNEMALHQGGGAASGVATLEQSLGAGVRSQAFPGLFGSFEQEEKGQSLWSLIDDRMRGRWRWCILIGSVLALGLGVLGYSSAGPMYQSTAAIHIKQSVPHLIDPSPDHTLQYYYSFCASQIQFMKTPQVTQLALSDPDLAKLPFAQQPGAAKKLKAGLQIEQERDTEFIMIGFEHEDPVVAQAAANAVTKAYYEKYGKHGGFDINTTLTDVKSIAERYSRELTLIRMERRQIVQKYEISDLPALQMTNMQTLAKLDEQIKRGERAMSRAMGVPQAGAPDAAPAPPSIRSLEIRFPMLIRLRQDRDEAKSNFDKIKDEYYPGTLQYTTLKNKADRAQQILDDELQKASRQWQFDGAENVLPDGTIEILTAADIEALKVDAAVLRERQAKLSADVEQLDMLKVKEEAAEAEQKKAGDRMRDLEIEKDNLSSFITIGQLGVLPDAPNSDARKKRAIMGIGLGLMASFGGFFLLGTIDRRAFGATQIDHMEGENMPNCLGVLPDLGASLSDPESSAMASHCVHQIRNQIEARREQLDGYVLAITSPFQGDGKTSIVMALGWSYAAAGFNTLLIDCDFVGRSLTRQLGLIGREGLKDALVAKELNGSVSRMPVDNLSAVPAGVDARFGPENVRRGDLERLLDQVRDKYDVIIIDTGPMLGSLESTPVTAAADGVVLSVRRGRSRSRLEECVNKLGMVGTDCVGVILNCAVRSDCNRYVSEASLAAADEERIGRKDANGKHAVVQQPAGERNALVRAMQSSNRNQNSVE